MRLSLVNTLLFFWEQIQGRLLCSKESLVICKRSTYSLPKATINNDQKEGFTLPRFQIKQLHCMREWVQRTMTGSRPLSPVFYFDLTHLNASKRKAPGSCPIRKPPPFFLYTALHYPHTTRWSDAFERSIYSGRGWGAMNLYSSVLKLKRELKSCCMHQLSHTLYWRVNKTPVFNLHWKEVEHRDCDEQYAQKTKLSDQQGIAILSVLASEFLIFKCPSQMHYIMGSPMANVWDNTLCDKILHNLLISSGLQILLPETHRQRYFNLTVKSRVSISAETLEPEFKTAWFWVFIKSQ